MPPNNGDGDSGLILRIALTDFASRPSVLLADEESYKPVVSGNLTNVNPKPRKEP